MRTMSEGNEASVGVMRSPLRDLLDRLGMDASFGDHHAAIGSALESRLTTEAWDAAFEFFSYTRKAHLDAAALTLARLLDDRHDVISFRQLPRLIESEAGRFHNVAPSAVRSTIIPHVEKEIATLVKMVEPIKRRRDQLMAHTAREQDLTNADWMIEFSDMESALMRALELVNYLQRALEGPGTCLIVGAKRENVGAELDRLMQPFQH